MHCALLGLLTLLTACDPKSDDGDTGADVSRPTHLTCEQPSPYVPTGEKVKLYRSEHDCLPWELDYVHPLLHEQGHWEWEYTGCELDPTTGSPAWSYAVSHGNDVEERKLYVIDDFIKTWPGETINPFAYWLHIGDADNVEEIDGHLTGGSLEYTLTAEEETITTEAGTFDTTRIQWSHHDYIDIFSNPIGRTVWMHETAGLIKEQWSISTCCSCSGSSELIAIH